MKFKISKIIYLLLTIRKYKVNTNIKNMFAAGIKTTGANIFLIYLFVNFNYIIPYSHIKSTVKV